MKVVFASGNTGKVREVSQMLAPLHWQVVPQSQLFDEAAAETGLTFVENALIKARFACAKTGLPAIADDSGLEVAALGGAPGIHSARFAGADATDSSNIDRLLAALQAVPPDQRQASFYCAMAFLRHAEDPTPVIALGRWNGEILQARRGEHGFGYDPIFFLAEFGKTMAQLEDAEKHAISHRGRAAQASIPVLKQRMKTRAEG